MAGYTTSTPQPSTPMTLPPAVNAPAIALVTRGGLAQKAYAVTGGAALRSAWRAGAAVHILGGSIGFLAVAILALQGSLFLLTPYNLLLYGCGACVLMPPRGARATGVMCGLDYDNSLGQQH